MENTSHKNSRNQNWPDGLKGHVFETSLADVQNDNCIQKIQDNYWRCSEKKNCKTNFCGMDLTYKKRTLWSKKQQTMIEAHVDVKASVRYLLHLFCVGFTKNLDNQSQKTSYTKH